MKPDDEVGAVARWNTPRFARELRGVVRQAEAEQRREQTLRAIAETNTVIAAISETLNEFECWKRANKPSGQPDDE